LRKRVLFKVYVAGLYLTEKRKSPAEVVALAGPKRVSITLMRNLPARRTTRRRPCGQVHMLPSPR
jgi:hypothetical protein